MNVNKQNMVQKTVDVLNYLAANPQGSALSDVARELNYPKTTVHDILKTLMLNDFVQLSAKKEDTGNGAAKLRGKYAGNSSAARCKYGIGAQVYTIGIGYLETSSVFMTAKPYLILLADKYEKTTFLAKRHYDHVVCIYKYASLHANAPTGNIGDQKRLHSTAIGKCYLAFDSEAFHFINTIDLPSFTPYTITDRKELKKHIDELRSLGYSWEKRESHIKMACLAAPIFTHGIMVGTISMTGWYKEDEDFTSQGNEIAQLAKLITAALEQGGEI